MRPAAAQILVISDLDLLTEYHSVFLHTSKPITEQVHAGLGVPNSQAYLNRTSIVATAEHAPVQLANVAAELMSVLCTYSSSNQKHAI